MNSKLLLTMDVAQQILKAPAYRLIHLCETGCVKPTQDAQGRGSARRFSAADLFLLAVSLELQNAAVSPWRIKHVNGIFNWLRRMNVLNAIFNERDLCGAIAYLGTSANPAMLHVKIQERAVKTTEQPMTFIQSKMELPMPAETGYGVCTSTAAVDIWPARISLNLTFISSCIQLH